MERVSRALKRGGRFALDTGMAAESVLPRLRELEWAHVDDILFLEENRYDVADGCVETTYTFVRDGKAHPIRAALGVLRERNPAPVARGGLADATRSRIAGWQPVPIHIVVPPPGVGETMIDQEIAWSMHR